MANAISGVAADLALREASRGLQAASRGVEGVRYGARLAGAGCGFTETPWANERLVQPWVNAVLRGRGTAMSDMGSGQGSHAHWLGELKLTLGPGMGLPRPLAGGRGGLALLPRCLWPGTELGPEGALSL